MVERGPLTPCVRAHQQRHAPRERGLLWSLHLAPLSGRHGPGYHCH